MPFLLPLLALWREFKILSLIGFLLLLYIVHKVFKDEETTK
jgi:hypothetical protein